MGKINFSIMLLMWDWKTYVFFIHSHNVQHSEEMNDIISQTVHK